MITLNVALFKSRLLVFGRTPWTEICFIASHVHIQKQSASDSSSRSELIRTHDPSVGKADITLLWPCESPVSTHVRHSVRTISYVPLELSYSLSRMCNRSRPFLLLCDTIQYFNNVSHAGYCNRKQETRAGKQEVMLHCMFVILASSSHLHTVERSC
jgi:hypothetical protein